MRGDMAEAALWSRALDLVREHHIESDADTGPLFDSPPPGSDPEILKRLRQMYEAGGWVLVVSSIADIADAVAEQKLRALPGLDAAVEAAVREALPGLRGPIPRIPLGR